jgi:hypothetical protein
LAHNFKCIYIYIICTAILRIKYFFVNIYLCSLIQYDGPEAMLSRNVYNWQISFELKDWENLHLMKRYARKTYISNQLESKLIYISHAKDYE